MLLLLERGVPVKKINEAAIEKLDEFLAGITELKKARVMLDEVWDQNRKTGFLPTELYYKLMDFYGIDESE